MSSRESASDMDLGRMEAERVMENECFKDGPLQIGTHLNFFLYLNKVSWGFCNGGMISFKSS